MVIPYTWVFWVNVRRSDLLSRSVNILTHKRNQNWHHKYPSISDPYQQILPTSAENILCYCPSNMCQSVLGCGCNDLPFVYIYYFQIVNFGLPIINIKGLLILLCSLIPWSYPQNIWGPLFFVYHIFVAYFDAADVIENICMVYININQGQYTKQIFWYL